MIAYDKYGKMTPEFQEYQQVVWDSFRGTAEKVTLQAIAAGVCPNAIRDSMVKAVECGSIVASAQAFVDDHQQKPNRDSPEGHMGFVKGL